MDSFIIGLGHKARRGKDTVARTIVEARSDKYDVRRYAFADALKREADELNIWDWCRVNNIPYDNNPPKDDPLCRTVHGKQRHFLQWYGTEFRRKMDPFYWVKKLDATIREEKPQIAIITDMRFLNEAYWVRDSKGVTVRIDRIGFDDVSAGTNPGHISEIALDNYEFDYALQTADGNVEDLKSGALQLFDVILDSLNPPYTDFTASAFNDPKAPKDVETVSS